MPNRLELNEICHLGGFCKGAELLLGGSVINEATLSSFVYIVELKSSSDLEIISWKHSAVNS